MALGAGILLPLVAASPASAAACSPTTATSGQYVVVQFTATGSCDWSAPGVGGLGIEYLIVAGGGGGAQGKGSAVGGGGGGGAGGLLTGYATASGTVSITVGGGGAQYGTGEDSIAFSQTAKGGGGGGGPTGTAGGSGGGGSSHGGSGWVGNGGAGTTGQGNSGGNGAYGTAGAGGGGAGSAGADGASGGSGGSGSTSAITGSSRTYAIGGSGGSVSSSETGSSGASNTGNGGAGGGGGSAGSGGSGGSGIVIARYLKAPTFSAARTDADTVEFTTPAATGAISGYEYRVGAGSWTSVNGSTTVELTESTGVTIGLRATGTSIGDGDVSTVAVPTISAPPQNASKRSGETAQFSVTAATSDGGTLSYQWQKSTDGGSHWANVSGGSGGTTTTYTTPTVSYADPKAQFRVVVTNTKSGNTASITSDVAVLTVGAAAPTITAQPQSISRASDQTATFSVTATEPEGELSYQWAVLEPGGSWTDIDGATNASYTTDAVRLAMTGNQYRVKVTNTLTGADPESDSTTSNAATLTVGAAPPSFVLQPTGQSIRSDQTATFTAAATAPEGVVSYQWQVNSGSGWSDVSTGTGGTTVAYTTPKMMYTNPKVQYRVIATTTLAGGTPGTATTISNAVSLTVGAATPTVTTQPTDVTVKSGQAASFTVAATRPEGTLSYQWQHSTDGGANWSDVSGAIAATYSIGSVRQADAGQYRARVTNTLTGADPVSDFTLSDPATLVVGADSPTISSQPASTSQQAGQTATFSVTAAQVEGTLSYQWQVRAFGGTWTDIDGATAASYTTPALTVAMTDSQYRVRVTNTVDNADPDVASTMSTPATLTVAVPTPVIATQPTSMSVGKDDPATFSVSVAAPAGTVTTYQWRVSTNGGGTWTNIANATAKTYTTEPATYAMSGYRYQVRVTNTLSGATPDQSTLTSNIVTLTVTSPTPSIDPQPADVSVTPGDDATFTVGATSTAGTIGYQWQKSTDGGSNWADITNETSTELTVTSVSLADDGAQFRAVVTNVAAGSPPAVVNSDAATLNVGAPQPAISTQPADASVTAGDTATFTVGVTAPSSGVVSYQWQSLDPAQGSVWTDIAQATTDSYTTAVTTPGSNGTKYRVKVINTLIGGTPDTATTTSDAATLTVTAPAPVIGTPPADVTVDPGADAVFSASATGDGVLSYQWQRKTPGGTWADIDGATQDSYTAAGVTVGQSGDQFRVQVTATLAGATPDTATTASSAATVTVKAPTPLINTQPGAVAVASGETASFTVAASSAAGTLSYQWYQGGTLLNGETGATLTIDPVRLADAGDYTVEVTNTLTGATPNTAAVTSSPAFLTVQAPAPTIDTEPADADPQTGQTATFSVKARAAEGTLSYQWQTFTDGGTNWTDVGTDADSYTTAAVALSDSGTQVRVVVTATLAGANPRTATTTSAVATLTVAATPPVDPDAPVSETPLLGQAVTFTSGVPTPTDGGTLSYQWYLDGVLIDAATGSSFTVDPVTAGSQGTYTVVVTNTLGNGQTASTTVTAGSITVPSAPEPTIDTEPLPATVASGQSATFTAAATAGEGTVRYQWQVKNAAGQWVDIDGATQSTFTTGALSSKDDGTLYRVVVTSTEPGKLPTVSTSDPAGVEVDAPAPGPGPSGPTTAATGVGGTVTFTAPVTPPAEGTLSYQWLLNGVPVDGATGASLTLSPVRPEDAGKYTVVVTTTLPTGKTTSVTVEAGTLVIASPQALGPETGQAGQQPGGVMVMVDGQPQQVQMTSGRTGVDLTGQGFTLRLAGLEPDGSRMPTDANGNLMLVPGGALRTSGDGFAPDAPVRVFVMSTPRALGTLTTNTQGVFAGQLDFPKDLAPGVHTVQVNGYTPDGKVRSLSLGVVVAATGQAQKANAKATPPTRIKKRGLTVITRPGAATTTGQAIRTQVRCIPRAASAAGQRRYCRTIAGPDGKLTVRTFGIPHLKIVVIQTAPGTATHSPYRARTVYVNGMQR